MNKNHNPDTLTWWRKVGYGLGDIYSGGSGFLISFYLQISLYKCNTNSPSLPCFIQLHGKRKFPDVCL